VNDCLFVGVSNLAADLSKDDNAMSIQIKGNTVLLNTSRTTIPSGKKLYFRPPLFTDFNGERKTPLFHVHGTSRERFCGSICSVDSDDISAWVSEISKTVERAFWKECASTDYAMLSAVELSRVASAVVSVMCPIWFNISLIQQEELCPLFMFGISKLLNMVMSMVPIDDRSVVADEVQMRNECMSIKNELFNFLDEFPLLKKEMQTLFELACGECISKAARQPSLGVIMMKSVLVSRYSMYSEICITEIQKVLDKRYIGESVSQAAPGCTLEVILG
jgi:hypothetical protein